MQHSESSIKVYHTKEYGRFNMITGNRQLNESKIKRIKRDIDSGLDVLRYCPVLVKENKDRLDIIDGQHRFWVSKQLGSPMWYILAENFTLHQIAKVNSNTERWSAKDYINCYVALNNNDYKTLQEFLDKYQIPVTTALSLLFAGAPNSSRIKDIFEAGNFKVNHKDYAYQIIDTATRFNHPDRYQRHFLVALHKVLQGNQIKVEELIEKVNDDPNALQHSDNYKEYLVNLEIIFNKNKHKRVTIY